MTHRSLTTQRAPAFVKEHYIPVILRQSGQYERFQSTVKHLQLDDRPEDEVQEDKDYIQRKTIEVAAFLIQDDLFIFQKRDVIHGEVKPVPVA